MKNTICIFLFLSLLAPFLGTYIYVKHQIHQVKREIKWKIIAGIDESELVLLEFTKEETQTLLNWKHSKEFEYKGEMYDIVSTEIVGDSVKYHVWWDHEETKLNRQLNNLVASAMGQDQRHNENQNRFFSFLKSIYTPAAKAELSPFAEFLKKYYGFRDLPYSSIKMPPTVPPPKFSLFI